MTNTAEKIQMKDKKDLVCLTASRECSLYTLGANANSKVTRFIASTPETRKICNDPFVVGMEYTRSLQVACTKTLTAIGEHLPFQLEEQNTVVLHILRGGLNFGLREAFADAFSWNAHPAAFISAQRARESQGPGEEKSEKWHITEKDYRKIYLPKKCVIAFGDVVATGTSLQYGLDCVIEAAQKSGSEIIGFLFFTIGGPRSEEILEMLEKKLKDSPSYKGSAVIYFEGRFLVAERDTPVTIKYTGTDLLRTQSTLAPEFVASQQENPAYPLERCTIYDAGSRAFYLPEYLEDVREYWEATLELAESGFSFESLLKERFPELSWQGEDVDLAVLCKQQLQRGKK